MITGLATGTAVCVRALPLCKPLRIVRNQKEFVKMDEKPKELFNLLENMSEFNTSQLLKENIVSI